MKRRPKTSRLQNDKKKMNSVYYFTPQELLLKNLYPNSSDIPLDILEIDKQEEAELDKEKSIIDNYSKSKITAMKICNVVFGIGMGIAVSMLFVPFFPLQINVIDNLAYSGMFIGAFVGYFLGIYADKNGASDRMAIFYNRITPKRIERMQSKLEKVNALLKQNNSKDKEKIEISKNHIETCLKEKGSYGSFFEFFNLRDTYFEKIINYGCKL